MNRLIVSRLCALYIHHMFIIILFVGQYEYFVGPHTHTATQYYFDDVQTAFRIGVNDFSVCACVSSKWSFSEFFLCCAESGVRRPLLLAMASSKRLNRFVTKPPIGRAIQVADVRDEWPVWRFRLPSIDTRPCTHGSDWFWSLAPFYLHCSAILVANKAPSTKLMEPFILI